MMIYAKTDYALKSNPMSLTTFNINKHSNYVDL